MALSLLASDLSSAPRRMRNVCVSATTVSTYDAGTMVKPAARLRMMLTTSSISCWLDSTRPELMTGTPLASGTKWYATSPWYPSRATSHGTEPYPSDSRKALSFGARRTRPVGYLHAWQQCDQSLQAIGCDGLAVRDHHDLLRAGDDAEQLDGRNMRGPYR